MLVIEVVKGRAVPALEGMSTPDAIFVGGGINEPGLLKHCWAALAPGGRLVPNVVSVEGEAVLDDWHRSHGGGLTRIAIARCEPLGYFRGWCPDDAGHAARGDQGCGGGRSMKGTWVAAAKGTAGFWMRTGSEWR